MPTLMELVRGLSVAKQELVDALETLASNGKDLGFVEAAEVIAALDRCAPPLARNDLEKLRVFCRRASGDLRHLGKSYAAQDWAKILDSVENRLAQMP